MILPSVYHCYIFIRMRKIFKMLIIAAVVYYDDSFKACVQHSANRVFKLFVRVERGYYHIDIIRHIFHSQNIRQY